MKYYKSYMDFYNRHRVAFLLLGLLFFLGILPGIIGLAVLLYRQRNLKEA